MTAAKVVVPREPAKRDIQVALDYYLEEAGPDIAAGFVDALQEASSAIARRPATGSPRYAHELDLPGLRSRKLKRFPYLIFYMEREDHIDVWRVLHAQRDIPSWLQGNEY